MFVARATPPDAAIDAEIIDRERRIAAFRAAHAVAQPTKGELMGRAVEDTDFLGDIDRGPHILATVAATAAEAAEELWEEEHGWPQYGVPLALIQDVTAALIHTPAICSRPRTRPASRFGSMRSRRVILIRTRADLLPEIPKRVMANTSRRLRPAAAGVPGNASAQHRHLARHALRQCSGLARLAMLPAQRAAITSNIGAMFETLSR
jgi:hypothetical protein